MVEIKRLSGAAIPAPKTINTEPKKKLGLTLPTEPNEPSSSLSDYSMLLYGAKKIGKTSLCSHFPDAMFLALEPGTKALSVFARRVHNFTELEEYITLLESDTKFKNVIVDTADIAYEYCMEYVCKNKGISHPSDEEDYGATWTEVKNTFKKIVNRLVSLPGKGVIFVSHDTERTVELRDGTKVDRVQPTMSSQAMSVIEAIVDLIFNYSYDGNDRFLQIDGSHTLVAGCRIETHFLRKDGQPRSPGDRVRSIPMGRSSLESYNNLITAFNNEQVDPDPLNTRSHHKLTPIAKLAIKK